MKEYTTPMAEKLVFDYTENVTASNDSYTEHGDMGIGVGGGGGCDHNPGHGKPHKPHPVFPNGKP
jgi:hypothetical protein